jgi:ribosomal protein L37AE/L43A
MSDHTAWLALAVSGKRHHGSNDGYDDLPSAHYSWDDTVPNSRAVAVGDIIAVWDRTVLLGVSVIEEITTSSATKRLHRCPTCQKSKIGERDSLTPRYKCYDCKATFDTPASRTIQVTTYRSRHDAAWIDLAGALSGDQLRALCLSPKSQLSLRPLNWTAFTHALAHDTAAVLPEELLKATQDRLAGGHTHATVRVRIGQANFRRALLQTHGPVCTFTGPAPEAVLEAAHLYSYAEHATHDTDGGMLLRRDIHRLFDLGQLAINPDTHTIDVGPPASYCEEYKRLQSQPLHHPPTPGQARWLTEHWHTHRAAPL